MKWLKNLFKKEPTNNTQPPEPKKSTVDIDAIIANAPKFEVIEGEPDELNAYLRLVSYYEAILNTHRDMSYEEYRRLGDIIIWVWENISRINSRRRLSAMTDRELLVEIAMNQKEN